MTRDELIAMAREADIIDFRDESDDPHVAQMVEFLHRFAALVAAAEREACAKLADAQLRNTSMLMSCPPKSGAAWEIAAAIRARGASLPL